ncbi:MAG TPA: histidine kinase [Bryobacteraceae bacterium]|nr:histidine kinase [Bryobacteraceae bacterium]
MFDIFGEGRYLSVNILGHAAGVLIFGFFLALMLTRRSVQQLRATRLSLIAAGLALVWNVCPLLIILIGAGHAATELALTGIAFCALSVLPSVLLDLCLQKRFRPIVRLGYGLSSLSVLAHIVELFRNPADFHRLGLAIITVGFGLLSAVAVCAVLWSGEENPRAIIMRILSAMSLFLFAASFAHFSSGRAPRAWSTELVAHHAGIPLALFIIMQDYRFVLLDAFARVLVNGILAGAFAVAVAHYGSRLDFPMQVLLIGAALWIFASARGFLQRAVTKLVFRQPDTEIALRETRALSSQATDETGYLEHAAQYIARLMRADLLRDPAPSAQLAELSFPTLTGANAETRALQDLGVEAIVPLGFSQAERRYLLLGPRRGGRRYLSEDLELLARLAACVSEQVELIRQAETRRLVMQAELRALQAQIHPHFLFNALNTLYGIIPRQAAGARRTLLNLAEIFRYFLQSDKAFVPLEEELRIVRAYLEIEELRLGDKLRVTLDVDQTALREPVPVLSIQPLVENAIKHGVTARPQGGAIQIHARREEGRLHIQVHDTGPGFESAVSQPRAHAGVGLENVSRRLVLCYGAEAKLRIESRDTGATVSFVAPCGDLA